MRLALTCTLVVGLAVLALVPSIPSRGQEKLPPELVARTDPISPDEQLKKFHLPEGFAIELVAAEPMIRKPINLDFDDRGRIWVTESVEYPRPADPGSKGRDSIKVLEDTNGDGKADKMTVFADGLNIPIGVLPITNGCIAYSIPNIYKLLDTNGDGVADKREAIYRSFGFEDTHGMASSFTWGFDGWVYACHGFHNTSKVKGADDQPVEMQSGNTYRFRPDGSHIEQFTHGQVNPFGLCFDPLGNIFTADCHSKPAYQILRGAHYPSFLKGHDGMGFGPELMSHGHNSTAICGIVHYAADHFPPAYRDTLFIGNVVTNRINHDRLEKHGSSYRAVELPDFLRCDDPWFRPVDIKLGPDGALYIADFYNRIIGHYEVPLTHPGRDHEHGRIWRVVYRGPDGKGKPVLPRADWGKASVAELVDDLGHPNLAVRTRATNQLVERGGEAGQDAVRKVMQPQSKPTQRIHGLWVLERQKTLDNAALTAATADTDTGVRVHAMRVLAERKEWSADLHKLALAGLKDADASVRRNAAEALGRHPGPENLAPLLALRQTVAKDDTHLLHVVRLAMRDQLVPGENWSKLPTASWSEADARAVADVAPGVHSAEAAGFLMTHLQKTQENGFNVNRYLQHVARHGSADVVQQAVAYGQASRPDDLRHQAALYRAIERGTEQRGAKPGEAMVRWGEGLTGKLLAANPADLQQSGVELAGSLKMASAQDRIVAIAEKKAAPDPLRLAAFNALIAIDAKGQAGFLGKALADLGEPVSLREQVANALARSNTPAGWAELVKAIATAPAPLQRSIALAMAGSNQGGAELLNAVASGKASARLLQETPVRLRLEQAKVPDLKDRLATLTRGLKPPEQGMLELMVKRRKGFGDAGADATRGAKVFEKHCAICHQVAGKGTKVGPQLDGIGARGLDRLLEDLLDPNRNVDQAFRSTTIELKNGTVVNGLVLREEGEVVVVADNQGKEIRVTKNTIQERTVSQLSPMPGNQADLIREEADFYDLIAYLLAQKPSP